MKKMIAICAIALMALVSPAAVMSATAAPRVSPDPYMETDQMCMCGLGREPKSIGIGSRAFIANVHWQAWTQAGFDSVAVATATYMQYVCAPSTPDCTLYSGGGYVSSPVNIMMEWPLLEKARYVFSEIVLSSQSSGTTASSAI
jgi:hypothetical protein